MFGLAIKGGKDASCGAMYSKNLITLLQLLSVAGASGMLRVGPFSNNQPDPSWQGSLLLLHGSLRDCRIDWWDGSHMRSAQGEKALKWLHQVESLIWRLETTEASTSTEPGLLTPIPADLESEDALLVENLSTSSASQWEEHFPTYMYKPDENVSLQRTEFGRLKEGVLMHDLPREERAVFALIDGRRTVSEIARLLKKPPETTRLTVFMLKQCQFVK